MNKRLQSLLVTVLLFQCITGLPQSITVNNIQRKDVDYGRLARIDTLVNSYIDKGWVHGVVTLVVKGGEIVQYKGYGYADAESRKPMHKDDLFRIASQTKAIVSTAIMILYEEGKFTLDEPIADFLPAWRNPSVLNEFHASDTTYTTVPAKRDITFRDLLTHTGGGWIIRVSGPRRCARSMPRQVYRRGWGSWIIVCEIEWTYWRSCLWEVSRGRSGHIASVSMCWGAWWR